MTCPFRKTPGESTEEECRVTGLAPVYGKRGNVR